MEREQFIKPVRNFILGVKLEHAINTGNVNAVESLSDKLGLSEGKKGMNLIEAYGALVAKTQDIMERKRYENAIHDTYRKSFPSSEV